MFSLISHDSHCGRSESFPSKRRQGGRAKVKECYRRSQPHFKSFCTSTRLSSAPTCLSYSVATKESHTWRAGVNTFESKGKKTTRPRVALPSRSHTVSLCADVAAAVTALPQARGPGDLSAPFRSALNLPKHKWHCLPVSLAGK